VWLICYWYADWFCSGQCSQSKVLFTVLKLMKKMWHKWLLLTYHKGFLPPPLQFAPKPSRWPVISVGMVMPSTCLSYSEQLTADKLSLNTVVAASGYTICVHTVCEVAAGLLWLCKFSSTARHWTKWTLFIDRYCQGGFGIMGKFW